MVVGEVAVVDAAILILGRSLVLVMVGELGFEVFIIISIIMDFATGP